MNNFILKIRLIFFTVSVSDTGFVVSILRYIECSNIDGKYRYRPTDISVLLVSIQYRGNAIRWASHGEKLKNICICATGATNFTPVDTSAQSRPRSSSNSVETALSPKFSRFWLILFLLILQHHAETPVVETTDEFKRRKRREQNQRVKAGNKALKELDANMRAARFTTPLSRLQN